MASYQSVDSQDGEVVCAALKASPVRKDPNPFIRWFSKPPPLPPGEEVRLQTLPQGPTIAAGDLWATQPAVVMVTRRPG